MRDKILQFSDLKVKDQIDPHELNLINHTISNQLEDILNKTRSHDSDEDHREKLPDSPVLRQITTNSQEDPIQEDVPWSQPQRRESLPRNLRYLESLGHQIV